MKNALSAEPGKKNLFILIKLKRPLQNVQFCSSSRKAIRLSGLTAGVYWIFRGLKFESDPRGTGFAFHVAGAEIG